MWRIKQAPEEIQGGNTQCKHPERKSLRGSGNTIPQESGCLLHSRDQISWWQLLHNQGQGHQVQALLVRKRQRHCWCRSVCGRRVDRKSLRFRECPKESTFEVVTSFCYLGDMLSAAGGCELSTTTGVKTAWKKFKDLLPVLSSRHLSFKTRGRVYSSYVRSAMLHASETWPLTKPNLQCLQRNDRAMIRQICNVRPQDNVTTRSSELLVRLGIEDLDLILKERRLRWYGHVERSNGAVKTAFDSL